jgi:integration host factor subunit alpha
MLAVSLFLPQKIHKELFFMTLTKADIVEKICGQLDYSKEDAKKIVETLMEIIKSQLTSGEDVLISNFGKFCVKNKKERRGRNPATGDDLMLKPRRVVTFKCSGNLRKKIQEG